MAAAAAGGRRQQTRRARTADSKAGDGRIPPKVGSPTRATRAHARLRRFSAPKLVRSCCNIRCISSIAPRLDSGSLRLPHFGDCTQEGQPGLARALAHEPVRVADEHVEVLEALARDPDAAGVAVVDEDRRPAGLRVRVRRQPADVPAVAHREQREHGDLRVLGRVQRAEQVLAREVDVGELRPAARTRAPAS